MENNTATLRKSCREAVGNEVSNYAINSHNPNHHRLNIWHDGTASWMEEASADTQIIDGQHEGRSIQAIFSIGPVGTGSMSCDCDWCANGGTYDPSDDDHIGEISDMVLAEFDAIPVGYFNDER